MSDQDNTAGVPKIGELYPFSGHDWRVLDVQNGQILLISKDVTHVNIPYNKDFTPCAWNTCTLRNWLNSDFLASFSAQEQSRICLTAIENEANPWFGKRVSLKTEDRIFLLSTSEVVKYFGDSGKLKNRNEWWIDDQYNKERVANYNGKPAWWWLRSFVNYSNVAAFVSAEGSIYHRGGSVCTADSSGGVRPALWLNL